MKKLLLLICVFLLTQLTLLAQQALNTPQQKEEIVYAVTQPAAGIRKFVRTLESELSGADTVGRRHLVRVNNISFIVTSSGNIDSAWVSFRERPIHAKIIEVLKSTPWTPAEQDGKKVTSHQELLDVEIRLTKAALKRHRHWRSLPERLLSPYGN